MSYAIKKFNLSDEQVQEIKDWLKENWKDKGIALPHNRIRRGVCCLHLQDIFASTPPLPDHVCTPPEPLHVLVEKYWEPEWWPGRLEWRWIEGQPSSLFVFDLLTGKELDLQNWRYW